MTLIAPPPHLDAAKLFREHANFVANFVVRLGMRREEVDEYRFKKLLRSPPSRGLYPGGRPANHVAGRDCLAGDLGDAPASASLP